MAKKALEKLEVEKNVSISKAEVKSVIWGKVNMMWQGKWDSELKGRHLYHIQDSIQVKRLGSARKRSSINKTKVRAQCAKQNIARSRKTSGWFM